jgi:hypothetical protein
VSGGALPDWLMDGVSHAMLVSLKNTREHIDDTVMALTAQLLPVGTKRGWAHTISSTPDPPPPRGLTVDAFFDATSTRYLEFVDEALEILRSAYYDDPQRYGYLGWISLRYQGRSRAYLSPQHASDRTVSIEFAVAWRMHGHPETEWPDTPLLLRRIEDAARRFGGIQHWGLSNDLNRDDVARANPRLDTWRRVRWELTKGGTLTTFDSDFTRRCGLSDPPVLARAADFDNDGRSDLAVWRPGTGEWWIIDSSTQKPRAVQQWGQAACTCAATASSRSRSPTTAAASRPTTAVASASAR